MCFRKSDFNGGSKFVELNNDKRLTKGFEHAVFSCPKFACKVYTVFFRMNQWTYGNDTHDMLKYQ